MKKCVNCKMDNRDKDKYCRNCGIELKSSNYYVLINVFTVFAIIFLIFVLILFALLYLKF